MVVDAPVLQAVSGPEFLPADLNLWSKTRNVGLAFIENMELASRFVPNAKRYFDHIICGSTWCAEELRKMGISTSVALQGVDQGLFYPIENKPKRGRYVIGSFGKFEYRKGQDVVIAAFSKLWSKDPQMHLLTSWGNLWPETMRTMGSSNNIRFSYEPGKNWRELIENTMHVAGIPRDRYTLLDLRPHHEMPFIYHQCDVAVFANRVEAGTNLPLMECIACGIPAICTDNTGHKDISGSADVISNGSPEMLAEQITQVKDKGVLRSSKRSFVEGLSWDNTAKSVFEAINNTALKHDRL